MAASRKEFQGKPTSTGLEYDYQQGSWYLQMPEKYKKRVYVNYQQADGSPVLPPSHKE